MRKCFLRALLCLLAAALALGLVRLGVEKTMPDYPDSLGDSLAPEKITGEYLLRAAAAKGDTLPVFGSSELKTTQICTHPANFFAGKRCGFQVDLIGRGSCQSLVHAMAIAASGKRLTGKKAVLITAPQSYVEDGIAPDLFMANFSEQQMLSLLSDETLPAEQRQYLARRVNEKPLSEAIYRALGADPDQPAPKEQRVCRFALAHGFPADAVELAVQRTGKQRGQKSLDYTHGILRKWDEAGVHTISEITALEPESRASAAAPAAVGQSPAQPTDAATLAAWEQDWAARVRSHRRHTEE